jgi:hypothetical protein
MAAGATMEFSGKLQQGRAAQRQANAEAAGLEYQAAIEQDNALAQAQQIRRQGVRDRGQTVAAVAASGVKIGEGSALDAEREVMQDAEADAYMAILNGDNAARGLRADAQNRRRAGRDAKRASYLSAVGTLLSRGAQGYDLYKNQLAGLDLRGPTGTNNRSAFSFGNNPDWWARNGRSGD